MATAAGLPVIEPEVYVLLEDAYQSIFVAWDHVLQYKDSIYGKRDTDPAEVKELTQILEGLHGAGDFLEETQETLFPEFPDDELYEED